MLDLLYEARDIDQKITSQAKIDQWFEAKTKGLTLWRRLNSNNAGERCGRFSQPVAAGKDRRRHSHGHGDT